MSEALHLHYEGNEMRELEGEAVDSFRLTPGVSASMSEEGISIPKSMCTFFCGVRQ